VKPEIWLSFGDLKNVWTLYRRKIVRVALLAGAACAALLSVQPPKFASEATFKQSSGRVDQGFDIKNVFRAITSNPQESATQAIFYSNAVLRKTVEELGLQVSVYSGNKIAKAVLSHLWDKEDPGSFRFQDVVYDGNKPKTLSIRFIQPSVFEVVDAKGTRKTTARIGEKMEIDGVFLTCIETPRNLLVGKTYAVTVAPWRSVIECVKKRFQIISSKTESNILTLKFIDPDRQKCAAFLNSVMKHYQRFLIEENQLFTDLQLSYLERRKKELEAKFDQTLEENVAYLSGNLGDNGFISLNQEMETLSVPKEAYTSKLFDLQFELSRFEGFPAIAPTPLQVDLQSKLSSLEMEEKRVFETQRQAALLQQQEAAELLKCIETEQPLPSADIPFAPLISAMKEAKEKVSSASAEEKPACDLAFERARHHLTEHLRDFIQSIHLKQQSLQAPQTYAKSLESDFRGLDLSAARQLHVHYHNDLDRLHIALKELLYLRSQIQDSSFDLGSMAATPLDPITQKMIEKAGDLEAQLQDILHRSPREHERLKDALAMQKKYIAAHIGQTIDLHKIRIELIREKIGSLQHVIVGLINNEKKLIEEKLKDLKTKMATLPQKWRIENLLKLKTDLMKKMVEGLVHITETKILNRHLFNVESRPIDAAIASEKPVPTRIVFFSVLTALCVAFGLFFFQLLRLLIQGRAPTLETLRLSGLQVSGSLSHHCDSNLDEVSNDDLETLRRIVSELVSGEKKCAALFQSSYSDFSCATAELLSKRGFKPVVIDCNFNKAVFREDTPGLWDYLVGKLDAAPIRNGKLFDSIPAGGSTRHATELLLSCRFPQLLCRLKENYDCILLVSRASIETTEAETLLKYVDQAFVSYSIEECAKLIKFSRQKPKTAISFVQQPLGCL